LQRRDYTRWESRDRQAPPGEIIRRAILRGKALSRRAAEWFATRTRIARPCFGMITRVVSEKGFEILVPLLDRLLTDDVRLVILGEGDPTFENSPRCRDPKVPNQVRVSPELRRKERTCFRSRHGRQPDSVTIRGGWVECDVQLEVRSASGRPAQPVESRKSIEDHDPMDDSGNGFLCYEYSTEPFGRDQAGSRKRSRSGAVGKTARTRN